MTVRKWLKISSVVLMSSLFVAACGGGGGSGGGSSSSADGHSSDSGSDSNPQTTINSSSSRSVLFPLIDGAGWKYQSGSSVTVVANRSDDIDTTEPLFELSGDEISYYYTSSPDKIEFWGIGGDFSVQIDAFTVKVKSVIFDEPVVIWRSGFADNSSETFEVTGVVKASAFGVTSNVGATFTGSVLQGPSSVMSTPYGELPVTWLMLTMDGEGSYSGIPLQVGVTDQLRMAKGIGPVSHETEVTYDGSEVAISLEQTMTGLHNLLEPIVFENSQGTAVLADGSDSVVRMADGSALSTTTYQALNAADVSWLTLSENSSNQFVVEGSGATVPSASASEVFYFAEDEDSEPLPLNVTIIQN